METFKQDVNEWLELHEEVKQKTEEIKESRQRKKELDKNILQYMIDRNIDICNLSNGFKLELKMSKTKSTLNKDAIIKGLFDFFQIYLSNPEFLSKSVQEKADMITHFLFQKREVIEKPSLCLKTLKPEQNSINVSEES